LRALDRTYLTDAILALLAFIAVVMPIAGGIAAIDSRSERAVLGYGFAHVPRAPGQTLAIVAANLTVLFPFLAMAVLVQARWSCHTPGGRRAFRWFCDLVVAIPAFHNLVLVVAGSVGAYGWRMVLSMLPAGPFELAAFALAASVYLRSRRAGFTRGQIGQAARIAALSFAVLLLAAATETYA
jgi:hypothetical protein